MGLIGVNRDRKIVGMVAIVGNAKPDPLAQIALQSEVPFLDDGVFVVNLGRQIEELRTGLGDVRGERVGEFVDRSSVGSQGIGEIADIARPYGPAINSRRAQERLNEPTVSATQHCLVITADTPSETNAGREVLLR